jgi:hypothetical protein
MNPAQKLVATLYFRFQGRIPVKVGLTDRFAPVYPFVFENESGVPIGLIGCAWSEGHPQNLVQIYHISAFHPGKGEGTKALNYLCAEADRNSIALSVIATALAVGDFFPMDDLALDNWYRKLGFKGEIGAPLTRQPKRLIIRFDQQ